MQKLNGQTSEMRYLLGTLSPAETDLMEEALFQDDTKLQELEVAEIELIDAYVRKQLPPSDRKLFEQRLQESPSLLERVRFSEALKDRITESVVIIEPTPRRSWWRQLFAKPAFATALATGLVVVIGSGVIPFVAWRSARNESIQIAAERAVLIEESKRQQKQSTELQAKADQLEAELKAAREQGDADRKLIEQLQQPVGLPSTIASIFLTPGRLRGESGNVRKLTLLPGATKVQLNLSLTNTGYSSYNVSVETADGDTVTSQDRLIARGSLLSISIPARRLPPGDYSVRVSGVGTSGQIEIVDDYQFGVLQRR